jgi:hypothetical protein
MLYFSDRAVSSISGAMAAMMTIATTIRADHCGVAVSIRAAIDA